MTANPALRYKNLDNLILLPNFNFTGETPMNINDKAPDFTLQDQNGKELSLKDFRGKVVVLYFYPRADTPGCTIESCEFRDTYKPIQKTGAVLLGISPDTPQAQKKFQDKFSLPFPLVADADKKVADAFGVLQEKNMYGKKVMGIVRTTFIIGPDGKIQHIFPKVKAEGRGVDSKREALGRCLHGSAEPLLRRAWNKSAFPTYHLRKKCISLCVAGK